MIFDGLELPKDQGATDLNDSARLAGIMTTFEWPQKVDCSKYVVNKKYVRHPNEKNYISFSRDQFTCLIAGLYKQGHYGLVDSKFIDGKDFLSPSVKGHEQRCKNKKSSWIQDQVFWFDILWACYIKPTSENNQLLCMLETHYDKKYIKFYLKNCKVWRENIRSYWCGWRNEPELAEHIIKFLERYL